MLGVRNLNALDFENRKKKVQFDLGKAKSSHDVTINEAHHTRKRQVCVSHRRQCLSFSSTGCDKYRGRSNLKEKVFIDSKSITAGKSRQQEEEATCHLTLGLKQRALDE